MKKIACVLVMAMLAPVKVVIAEDIASAVQIAEAEAARTEVITELMEFAPGQADDFWPVYRAYRGEMVEVLQTVGNLVREYVDTYPDAFPGKRARQILDSYLASEMDAVKIKTKYAKRFRKVLSDDQTLRLMQIDNKLNAAMAFTVANEVPLAK